MINAAQIRAARAMIGAKQSELADAAGISLATLNNIERGVADPRASTLEALVRSFEAVGISFDDDSDYATIRLNRISRPASKDSAIATLDILHLLAKNGLEEVGKITFYLMQPATAPTTDGADAPAQTTTAPSQNGLSLGILACTKERKLLFDHIHFNATNIVKLTEICGILLAAKLLHAKHAFLISAPFEDTAQLPVQEAVSLIESKPASQLNSLQLITKLRKFEEIWQDISSRTDHPLHQLLELDGVETGKAPNSDNTSSGNTNSDNANRAADDQTSAIAATPGDDNKDEKTADTQSTERARPSLLDR